MRLVLLLTQDEFEELKRKRYNLTKPVEEGGWILEPQSDGRWKARQLQRMVKKDPIYGDFVDIAII